jgi:hypothetical protein
MSLVKPYYHVLWIRDKKVVGGGRFRYIPDGPEDLTPFTSSDLTVKLKPMPCPPAEYIVVLGIYNTHKPQQKKKRKQWKYCVPLSTIRGRVQQQWTPSCPLMQKPRTSKSAISPKSEP